MEKIIINFINNDNKFEKFPILDKSWNYSPIALITDLSFENNRKIYMLHSSANYLEFFKDDGIILRYCYLHIVHIFTFVHTYSYIPSYIKAIKIARSQW